MLTPAQRCKLTLVQQSTAQLQQPVRVVSADESTLRDEAGLRQRPMSCYYSNTPSVRRGRGELPLEGAARVSGGEAADLVVRAGKRLLAIEVKSRRRRDCLPGMVAFADAFQPDRTLLVGGDGIELEAFLSRPVMEWLQR